MQIQQNLHPQVEQSILLHPEVLEIPTPRWTTYDAQRFNLDLPDDVPVAIQERVYSSPIWYTPIAE